LLNYYVFYYFELAIAGYGNYQYIIIKKIYRKLEK